MILSDVEILKRVREQGLIENFDETQLQSASYDIAITDTIQRFRPDVTQSHPLISLDDEQALASLYEPVNIGEGYKLRPGELVLVTLREIINLPADLAAHIRPRTSFLRIGIFVSDQHVNPTYRGRLTIGLQNANPIAVLITPSLSIGQIVFEQVGPTPPSEGRLYRNKANAKYQGEEGFTSSRISDEVRAKLGEFLKRLEKP